MAILAILVAATFSLQDRAFVEKHCAECHGPDDPKGGLLAQWRALPKEAPGAAP